MKRTKPPSRSDDDDRPLHGAKAIAAELGLTVRATYHLLEAGRIPASKLGKTWISSRRRVRAPYCEG